MRFLSRFIGFWLVAGALVAAVVDGAKSIAVSAFVTTPLAETWTAVAAYTGGSGAVAFDAAPWPLGGLLTWMFAAPTVAVLFVPGVALLLAGARRRRHPLGREFAT